MQYDFIKAFQLAGTRTGNPLVFTDSLKSYITARIDTAASQLLAEEQTTGREGAAPANLSKSESNGSY